MKQKTIKVGALYREAELTLERSPNPVDGFIDEANRVVTLSFSSTEPVEREFGYEVLDHKDGAANLERLVKAGSLLVNHDKNDLVGVVEDSWIEGDRGHARVRFGKSERASEIFNDVVDGIRKTVSFGYRVMEMERERTSENSKIPTYTVTRWMPFEISLVTVPADMTVGVGRNEDEDYENEVVIREHPSTTQVEIKEKDRKMENKDFEVERENSIKAERKRINSIMAIADKVRHLIPDVDSIKEEFLNSDRSVDAFNTAIVERMDQIKFDKLESRQPTELGMSDKERGQYSLMRLAEALSTNKWDNAGLELEVSRAQADMLGTQARGAFLPLDVLSTRADAGLTTTAAGVGGGLVPTDFWGSQYIDVLRANSVVAAMGARILPGLVGDVDIPKASNEATFSWLTEGADNDSTQYSATTVALSPADIGGALGFTRKLMKQTGNPAVEQMMRDSLNTGIGVFLDKQVLVGTGTGASGLTTHAGTKQDSGTTGAYSAVTWAHVLSLESAVATNNAEMGSLGYVASPAIRGYLKGKGKDSSNGIDFIMRENNMLNGYKFMSTSHASNNLFYGNWNDVLVPMWGGVDIVVDTATNIKSGGIVLRAFLATDIAFRHTESFAVQIGIVE